MWFISLTMLFGFFLALFIILLVRWEKRFLIEEDHNDLYD